MAAKHDAARLLLDSGPVSRHGLPPHSRL